MKTTTTMRGGLFRLAALVFLSLFLLVALPSPAAHADPHTNGGVPVLDMGSLQLKVKMWMQRNADWIEALGYLGKIITGIGKVVELAAAGMDKFNKAMDEATAVRTISKEAMLKGRAKIGDSIVNTSIDVAVAEARVETRSKFFQPRNQVLCKNIMAYQLALTTQDFEQAVACMVLQGIDNLYRGAYDDGYGPKYAYDLYKLRCALKLGSKLDGYPSDCIDDSTTSKDGRKLADADLSPFTLDGSMILEVPKFKSTSENGITYSIPDPQNTEQKFWTAAFLSCAQLAGPRPTPPRMKDVAHPEKMGPRALWQHGAVMQSVLEWPCALALAYNSRPNPDEAYQLVQKQNKLCFAFKAQEGNGLKLPETFDDCKRGISPRQRHFLEETMCTTNQHFISLAHGGATDPEMLTIIHSCALLSTVIDGQQATREQIRSRAIPGLARLPEIWGEVARQ